MGLFSKLMGGGWSHRPKTAGAKTRPASAPALTRAESIRSESGRGLTRVKNTDMVTWTNPLGQQKASNQMERVQKAEAESLGRVQPGRDGRVAVRAADGTEWSLYHPALRSGQATLAQVFPLRELQLATRGFSPGDLVGEGGFGKVYKAVLADGRVAAVKQLDRGRTQGDKEFWVEVDMLSQLHSPHVVRLWGFCSAANQRLLVYEYMRNGSLQDQLQRNGKVLGRPPLDWPSRLQIGLDVACALEYLHEVAQPAVVHGDLKSSNILLDFDFKAKVADLGLARRVPDSGHVRTDVLGTQGYCAPDYASSGKMTVKSDVYSFGVVLLELITGRPPIEKGMDKTLVTWALPLLRDKRGLAKIADPRLEGRYSMKSLCQVAAIATLCLQSKGEYRPLMGNVVTSLLPLVFRAYSGAEGIPSEVEELLSLRQQQDQQPAKSTPGPVHRAHLSDGREVILAELSGAWLRMNRETFEAEAQAMSRLNSPHLLTPWGHTLCDAHRMLMFTSVAGGSLDERLCPPAGEARGRRRPLDWHTRLLVALDCARGLGSLHEKGLVHGDFKATSVLLDPSNKAKVSAFGLTRPGASAQSSGPKLRHVAPEIAATHKASQRGDVYAYGVLLLQLIIGEYPSWGEPLAWAMSLVTDQKRAAAAVDPAVRGQVRVPDVCHVAAIAATCLQPKPAHRPLMSDVISALLTTVGRAKFGALPMETGVEPRVVIGGEPRVHPVDEVEVPGGASPERGPNNTDISVFGERTPDGFHEPVSDTSSDEVQAPRKSKLPASLRLTTSEKLADGQRPAAAAATRGEDRSVQKSSCRTAISPRDHFPPLNKRLLDGVDSASDGEEQFLDEDETTSEQGTAEPSVHDGWKSTPSGQVYVSRDYDFSELRPMDESTSALETAESDGRNRIFEWRNRNDVSRAVGTARNLERRSSFDFDEALRREVKLWPVGATRAMPGTVSVGRARFGRSGEKQPGVQALWGR